MRVLLVEDNPGDVRLTREAFHEIGLGHELNVARNGEEALRYLRRESPFGDASRPDIIFLDLNLPGLDGHQVLQAIKDDPELRPIPVAVLTTSEAEEDVRKSYSLHANCYLTKPSGLDSFVDLIRTIDNFWLTTARLPSEGR